MANIIVIMKDTREKVVIQPNDHLGMFSTIVNNQLVEPTRYVSKNTWLKMCQRWFLEIQQGVIINSKFLKCYLYLAPETVKIEEPFKVCTSCGQEIPDAT